MRIRIIAATIALGISLFAQAAIAQQFPTPGDRGMNERDPVTGYLCVTPACDVVRMSEASCICTKDNPNERRLERLKLTCSKRKGGQWVACPVKPRYGG